MNKFSVKTFRQSLYRRYGSPANTERMRVAIYIIIFILSTMLVFTLPSPIRPKTSIGQMGALLILLSVWIGWSQKLKVIAFFRSLIIADFLVLLYLLTSAVSEFFAYRISQEISLRLITYAAVFYFILRISGISQQALNWLLAYLSHAAIFIASLTLSQLIFPTLFNSIASEYFFGKEAYGLTIEFGRGRLFPWGGSIFLSPFFYAYALPRFFTGLLKDKIYFFAGFSLLTISLLASNFRWTFLVYSIVTTFLIKFFINKKYLTRKIVYMFLVFFLVVSWIGLASAEYVFGYDLLDRILLREHHRDVEETLGRFTLYDQGINVFLSSPILGVGPGNYYDLVNAFVHTKYFSIFDQYAPFLVPIASHNELLTVLAETGVVGFIILVVFVYIIFHRLVDLYHNRENLEKIDQLFLIAMMGSFVTLVLYTLFENLFPQNYVFFFGLAAIVFAIPVKKNHI